MAVTVWGEAPPAVHSPAETDRTMTGLWLPAMKPKPWAGWRWMVTCRAAAGLRAPLSIPSSLSSNIARLQRGPRFEWNVDKETTKMPPVTHSLSFFFFILWMKRCYHLSHASGCPSWTLAIPWEEGAAWDKVALQRLCSVLQSFTWEKEEG